MADKTLNDVIQRMREEGQLDRNSGTHSIKSVKELIQEQGEDTRKTIQDLKSIFAGLTSATNRPEIGERTPVGEGANNLTAGDLQQEEREEDKYQGGVLGLLQTIADNTASRPSKPEKTKSEGPSIIDIGLGAIVAGGALGAVAGIVLGQLKAIETLIPPIQTLRRKLRILFKRTIPRQFAELTKSIKNSVRGLILAATIQFELIRSNLAAFGERFKKLLRPLQGIFKPVITVIRAIGNYVGRITKVFTGAFDEIVKVFRAVKNFGSGTTKVSKALKPIQDGVRAVMGFFKGIGTVFGRVAGFVGKIFAPIAIVMTVFDTAKGFAEGYEEDGLIGGLKGGLKGFINSLIGMPLDLLKNGIAWLMEKFNVNPETVEAVKNFSFVESFNKIIDGLFELPKKAIAWMSEKFTSISETVGEFITNVMGDPLGFVSKIIAAPYELLQKGVAWILSKFGFENAAEDVESFDIAGKIKDVIGSVIKLFTDAIDFYIGIFTKGADLLGGLVSGDYDISDVFKEILRNILPDPSEDRAWYDPIGLVQRAIPAPVYEYAGIDPETGEVLEELPVRTPEVEVPDMEVAPALNTEELEQGVAAAQNATKIEIPVETRSPVVGTAVETDDVRVERSDVTGREAQQLALQQQQQDLANQQAAQSSTAMVLNSPTSLQTNNNVSNSNTTVGMTGTSGDPLDKSWGGI